MKEWVRKKLTVNLTLLKQQLTHINVRSYILGCCSLFYQVLVSNNCRKHNKKHLLIIKYNILIM
jgi:hypothetical protein